MKIAKRISFVIMIVFGVVSLLEYMPVLLGEDLYSTETRSLGIIGGADGPTAICIIKGPSFSPIPLLLAIAGMIVWLILHFKMKKSS